MWVKGRHSEGQEASFNFIFPPKGLNWWGSGECLTTDIWFHVPCSVCQYARAEKLLEVIERIPCHVICTEDAFKHLGGIQVFVKSIVDKISQDRGKRKHCLQTGDCRAFNELVQVVLAFGGDCVGELFFCHWGHNMC